MILSDLQSILIWWFYIFIIGLAFLPLSKSVFSDFFDSGYIFAKTLGIAVSSYFLFLILNLNVIEFNRLLIFFTLGIFILINFFIYKKNKIKISKNEFATFLFQELFFFLSLFLWSYVKGFQPDINGLEKFMDFGFINSVLRTDYLPPVDMWFPPFTINYYYFGHFVTAVLTKMSNISPFITYNLMLATIFALTTTSSFSIVATLSRNIFKNKKIIFLSGFLASLLTALGGNLHTIYSFFAPYTPAENPIPFWNLEFLINSFPNGYWYPNATRFIPFTIHEFPSYSFVVSDLHGHVLDIPFVLLTIALILKIFIRKSINFKHAILISLFLSILYMTNAWDGVIYFGLFSLSVILINLRFKKVKNLIYKKSFKSFFKNIKNNNTNIYRSLLIILTVIAGFAIFSLPFSLNFSPFVSGIGVICAPDFLTNLGNIGPFLFEPEHCQRSPFWMLFILYSFFFIFIISFTIKAFNLQKKSYVYLFVITILAFSSLLILIPEFIYAKDIYPQHYRANTVFKLGYQAYIMLSLITSFSIIYILKNGSKFLWYPVVAILLGLNLMYPFFAVDSYFGGLKEYKGLDGISYLKNLYPDDYDAIHWIQGNIKGNPVILESQGDSYTDYGRISANTGLPSVLGWTVHEWLWRGDYSIPASRIDDVRALYEEIDIEKTKSLIDKYKVEYIYLGTLERMKYSNIYENKFDELGDVVYSKGTVNIYRINSKE